MLRVNQLIGFGAYRSGIATQGLQFHLDFRQSACYPGTGQDIFDLSGNSYSYFVGEDGSATASDPTYNAGPPAYFSYSLDWHQAQAAYSGSIMRTIARQDQNFTIEMGLYNPGISAQAFLCSTSDAGVSQSGFAFEVGRTANKLSVVMAAAVKGTSTTAMSTSAWHTIGLRGIADGSTCHFLLDGATDGTWTYNYTTFTSGDSTNKMRIGESGRTTGTGQALTSNARLMFVRIYNRQLTDGEVAANHAIDALSY